MHLSAQNLADRTFSYIGEIKFWIGMGGGGWQGRQGHNGGTEIIKVIQNVLKHILVWNF